MKIHLQSILFVLLLFVNPCYAQNNGAYPEHSILFYNTENFFDCENDTTKSDEEYLAKAGKYWTPQRFRLKAERLAKVIMAAGKWNPPVMVGLCEIENRDVLEALVKTEPLTKFRYKIIQKDSPDPRGIDVALLYRPDLFHPFDYVAIPVKDAENKWFKTRDILKVIGCFGTNDTLIVYVNHWPSRYGGIMETQKYRVLAAQTLKKAVDLDLSRNPKAKIVCMGDFNDTPLDQSISTHFGAKSIQSANYTEMINLSLDWMKNEIQTIKSKYRWEIFDQFFVSQGFLNASKGVHFRNAEIFKGNFLLEKDLQYGGVKPKRTYLGFKYHDGFSDHLPIVLRFEFSGQ